MSMSIDKDMSLGEVLDRYPQAEDIMVGFGMHCFSCPMSRMETLEEAAEVHGIDLDLLLEKLNDMDRDTARCKDDECAFDDEDECDCGCGCDDEACDCEHED